MTTYLSREERDALYEEGRRIRQQVLEQQQPPPPPQKKQRSRFWQVAEAILTILVTMKIITVLLQAQGDTWQGWAYAAIVLYWGVSFMVRDWNDG